MGYTLEQCQGLVRIQHGSRKTYISHSIPELSMASRTGTKLSPNPTTENKNIRPGSKPGKNKHQ